MKTRKYMKPETEAVRVETGTLVATSQVDIDTTPRDQVCGDVKTEQDWDIWDEE